MPNKINNIPLKELKGNELVVHSPRKFLNFKNDTKTKLNLNKMYKKAVKLSQIVSNLRRKVEILEGKYDFLEYCNYTFGRNNKDIINKLQKILDKKKSLENLFFYMIRNFFPNMKAVENTLPNTSPTTSIQTNNQINDLRNNEIISQIYKIFNLSDSNLSTNNISGNNNFIGNNNKIIDFQKKYFNDLDDQNNTNIKSVSFDYKDSQDNNSINISENDKIKNDKDILNVTSNNNSIDNKNKSNQFLNKKTARDIDNSISDGSKDLL